tara:strand:+ start:30 stop:260 length:231 start_codon:yes stop_codon:yes gene_type:complete
MKNQFKWTDENVLKFAQLYSNNAKWYNYKISTKMEKKLKWFKEQIPILDKEQKKCSECGETRIKDIPQYVGHTDTP